MKNSSSTQSALARLFSPTVYRELATSGRSALFRRLIDQTDVKERCSPDATVAEAFEQAFRLLKPVGVRHEYVYRTAITQNVLLGKHSLRTSSMLSEFRIGDCRADVVILNGTATVYEIKSERDSLVRLANQVDSYKRVFAAVTVIACDRHLDGILRTVPDDVGVMQLSSRDQITTIRAASNRPERISPISIFESVRSSEAALILKAMDIPVPQVPNTQRHTAMRELFVGLDPEKAHREMVRTLKRTRNLAKLSSLIDALPESLHANALSITIHQSDHSRLMKAVNSPLGDSASWG